MIRWGRFVARWSNVSGALIALTIAAAIFGQRIETTLFPVWRDVEITDVHWVGQRLWWTLDGCKVRDQRLVSTTYIFFYAASGERDPGRPLGVVNETRRGPAGVGRIPVGCYTLQYSTEPPDDASPGGTIVNTALFTSFHSFWLVDQKFGTVMLPDRPRR